MYVHIVRISYEICGRTGKKDRENTNNNEQKSTLMQKNSIKNVH